MIEYKYYALLLISIVLIYFAIKHYYDTKNLMVDGIKTKAKVIDLIVKSNDDGYTYIPVFEYKDKTGNMVKFKSDVGNSHASYDIGDLVNIVYSKNGNEQKVISFWGLYRWTIILLSIASPLLIIGLGYILYSRG